MKESVKISFREWAVLSAVFLLLSLLIIRAEKTHMRAINDVRKPIIDQEIMIRVEGAVKRPGDYPCHLGETVREFLKTVELTPEADRKKIAYKQILMMSQSLEIPKKIPRDGSRMKISLEEK